MSEWRPSEQGQAEPDVSGSDVVVRPSPWGRIAMFAALGLLILLGFGHELGPRDLKITMIMAFVPVPIYVLLVLWLDRMEKEPWYLLVIAFLYGGTFAIFFAVLRLTDTRPARGGG